MTCPDYQNCPDARKLVEHVESRDGIISGLWGLVCSLSSRLGEQPPVDLYETMTASIANDEAVFAVARARREAEAEAVRVEMNEAWCERAGSVQDEIARLQDELHEAHDEVIALSDRRAELERENKALRDRLASSTDRFEAARPVLDSDRDGRPYLEPKVVCSGCGCTLSENRFSLHVWQKFCPNCGKPIVNSE